MFTKLRLQVTSPLRDFQLLLVGASVSNLGFALLWPLTALYVHVGLHEPMTLVGLVMMVQAGAGLVGALAGGFLYDACGARRPLTGAMAASALLLACIGLDRSLWVYVVAMTGTSLALSATMPIFNAMAARIRPEGGRSAFNAVYVAVNAGVALGSASGGMLAAWSFRFAFMAAGLVLAMLGAAAAVFFTGPRWGAPGRTHSHAERAPALRTPIWHVVGWPTILLAGAIALQWLAYDQWEVTVPNFMVSEGYRLPLYSMLWSLNTIGILAAQPLLNRVVKRVPDMSIHLVAGSGLFLTAFGVLALAHSYPAYVTAMGLTTLGEMLVWPAVPAAAERRTPADRSGLVQGVVSMGISVGRVAGPLVGGLLFEAPDPGALFGVMAGVVTLGGVGYLVSQRPERAAGADDPNPALSGQDAL